MVVWLVGILLALQHNQKLHQVRGNAPDLSTASSPNIYIIRWNGKKHNSTLQSSQV